MKGKWINKPVHADIELNGIYTQRDEIVGIKDSDSGSYKLFLSPGLQQVSRSVIIEAW